MHEIQPIRIAYVIGQLTIGGTERHLLSLVNHIDRHRFQPYVICLSEEAPLAEHFRDSGVSVYILDRRGDGRLRTTVRLCRLLASIKPDVVHTFSYASRAGVPAAKFIRTSQVVVSFRTDPNRWMNALDRLIVGSANLILENSHHALSSYLSRNGTAAPPHEVVANGIDLAAFDRASRASFQQPPPDGTSSAQNAVCVVSSLRPVKCLGNLLVAFSSVHSRLPQTQLWIVGDGVLRAKLHAMALALDIESNVTFWGIRSDIPRILRSATVGVISSRYEGLCNAILEYMAAGLPVVATEVGGNPELVVRGETGLLVPFGDMTALEDSIVYLLQNPQAAREFGLAGRRRVERHFTIERMARETEAAYERLLNQERGFPARVSAESEAGSQWRG